MGFRCVVGLLFLSLAPAAAARAAVALEVEAPAALAVPAGRLRALDPASLDRIRRLVGLDDSGKPIRVVLAPEGSPLAAQAPPWVSGYAWGELGRVVLLPARVPAYPNGSLEELLRHEVAHVLIARAAGGFPVPRWFHEGLAMGAAGEWGLGDRSRLALALLTGGEPSLVTVEAGFGGGQGEVSEAYAVAGALVQDLLRRHGPGVAGRVLGRVRAGLPFPEAFRAATGETPAAAAALFWRGLSWGYRWLPFLTGSAALWLAITGLALVAFWRRRRRDAAIARAWAAQEEAEPTGPPGRHRGPP